MSSEMNIRMTADEAAAFQAFQKLAQGQAQVFEGMRKIKSENAAAARESKKLEAAGKRVFEQTRTPMERHNQKLKELSTLLQKNKIDQDTYQRAVRQSADAMKQAEGAGHSAFGPAMLGKITALAGALGIGTGLAGMVGLVKSAFAEANAEIDKAAEKLRATHNEAKRLWQVSESRKEYEGLSTSVRNAMIGEGMNAEQAGAMAFNLKSANRVEAMPALARTARFMDDPAAASEFYSTVTSDTAFGRNVGTPEQLISSLIAGAGTSKYDTVGTAKAAVGAVPTLKASGATLPEILGIMGALSYSTKSPEQLSTRMLAIDRVLQKWKENKIAEGADETTLGTGLLGTFDAMRKIDPEAYKQAKLTDQEFKVGAVALEGAFEQSLVNSRSVAEAGRSGALFEKKYRETPARLSLLNDYNQAESQKQVAMEKLAEQRTELDTATMRTDATAAATGSPMWVEKARKPMREGLSLFGADELATKLEKQRTIDIIADKHPDIFRKHLSDKVDVPYGRVRRDGEEDAWYKSAPKTKLREGVDVVPAIRDALNEIIVQQQQQPGGRQTDEALQRLVELQQENNELLRQNQGNRTNPALNHGDRR